MAAPTASTLQPAREDHADNAKQLGLAWFADLDTNRGQQATPRSSTA